MKSDLTKAMAALTRAERSFVIHADVSTPYCRESWHLRPLVDELYRFRKDRGERVLMWSKNTARISNDRAWLAHQFQRWTLAERLTQSRREVFDKAWAKTGIGSNAWRRNDPKLIFVPGHAGEHVVERVALRGYRELMDVHTLTLPLDWMTIVKRIGDGTGVVDGHLILSASLHHETALDSRSWWTARLLKRGRGYGAVTVEKIISCWPHGISTLHADMKRAMLEPTPPEVERREEAARLERHERAQLLCDEDLAALEDLDLTVA
ncbi:hypothetical protein [Bosea sp. (in: a-proteobacteria)]|uniref:hypothetical protein n=1 Tax=Bosea sp. (in: a-proteobacteria) TaxID=1871050 RepID=UPI002736762E|nr:hypothetical protein [Bosea sp. (in: a-proteobacteria)]MDP3408122.1 hypothetical protein [Bosea sp. (in: a-proteobacteria)]